MILVTGGAGFIGSVLQAGLTRAASRTVIVDRLGDQGKWRNLAAHPPSRIVAPEALEDWLARQPPIEMVFHMAAISETLAVDGDEVWQTNVEAERHAVGVGVRTRRALRLCVVRRDLRQRSRRLR